MSILDICDHDIARIWRDGLRIMAPDSMDDCRYGGRVCHVRLTVRWEFLQPASRKMSVQSQITNSGEEIGLEIDIPFAHRPIAAG